MLRNQIKNYFPYELRHRTKPENPLSSSRSARISVKLRSGPMITTDLLNWRAETKSPCAKAERALVMPQPGQSTPNMLLTRQRLCPDSKYDVGTTKNMMGKRIKNSKPKDRHAFPLTLFEKRISRRIFKRSGNYQD